MQPMCVNARVQGSVADLTKSCYSLVCEELKQLWSDYLFVVHDEIIGECPRGE